MSDSPPEFADMVAALRAGDPATREAVLLRFQPWLRLLARMELDSQLNAKLDPSDILQQTLLEAHRALPRFHGQTEAELAAFLRQILAHVLAHELRRYHGTAKRASQREVSIEESLARTSLRLADMLAAQSASPSQKAIARERDLLLAQAMMRLPEDYREVIILRNFRDLPHEEIARRMQRNVGAVRMLWVRALARLKQELHDVE
jgi:RNA polymerase sigma-70 factor (ECF subfamily)